MLKGFGSILEDTKAKAQALVGEMLMARATLNDLTKSTNVNIQARAEQLMGQQDSLEAELGDVKDQLDSGSDLSMADYAGIGTFLIKAKTQVDSVKTLNNEAQGITPKIFSATNIGIAGGVLALLGFGFYLVKKYGK